jgi:hypothetical protein
VGNTQFDCLEVLPYNVRAALDESGQKQWMNSFNSIVRKSKGKKEYRDSVLKAWQTLENDAGCRFFSGFVSTEDLDRQNDVVMAKMALDKINKHIDRGGTMIDTHTNRTVGSFIHADMRKSPSGKPGIYAHGVIFKGEPYFDTVWEQIKKGVECPTCKDVRKGFSIGGFAIDVANSCDAFGCHRDITDMSIHEISVCQDPANSAATIYEVNTLAKADEEMEDMENEINKAIREDSPAEDVVETPSPVQSGQNVNAPTTVQGQVPAQADGNDIKSITDKIKNMQRDFKEAVKLREELNEAIAQMSAGMQTLSPAEASVGVAKAVLGSPAVDTEAHQLVSDKKECNCPKELYGDVKDPQIKDSMEYLDNKGVEAAPEAKKDHGELMPGKMEGMPKTEKGPVGPAVETSTTKIKGFSNLKAKNAAIDEPDEEEEDEDEDIPEDVEIEKDCGCAKRMTQEQFKSKYGAKEHKETTSDKGDDREKNFGKEGKKELLQKCPGDGKASIPEDLMPMFQEFLQEKGIKMEPEVHSEEIEAPLEKTLYIDDNISEMDIKEMSDPVKFDSYQAIGKTELQRMRVKNVDAKMRLAKSLEVVDLSFLVPELKKGSIHRPTCSRCGYELSEKDSGLCAGCNKELADNGGNDPMNDADSNKTVPVKKNTIKKVKDAQGNDVDLPEPGIPKRQNPYKGYTAEKLLDRVNSDIIEENPGYRKYGWRNETLDEEGNPAVEAELESLAVRCPQCGRTAHKYNGETFCTSCGYHTEKHAGTPTKKLIGKAWKVFKKTKLFDENGQPIKSLLGEELETPDFKPSAVEQIKLNQPKQKMGTSLIEDALHEEGVQDTDELMPEKCPNCGKNSLISSERGHACLKCGYHDAPHEGSLKEKTPRTGYLRHKPPKGKRF